MLLPPDFLLHNRYLLKSHIGQGGFGITYIAYDQQLAVQVCIKELFLGGSSTRNSDMSVQSHSLEAGFSFQDFVERFLDEARQLARFKHPNIVRVIDVFNENDTAYMVMEFVEGETLQALVKREGALPESKALALISQVLNAVEEVHKKGMLHRDIKPDNLLVTAEGNVVLIDFGSAREFAEGQTTTQTAMITPGYAPIEQYSNRAQRGTYTDIYALGATLYYMVTGQKPIPATDRNLETLLSPHELNNQISPQLSSAVMMAMAMTPEERFQGVGDLRQAISMLQEKPSTSHQSTEAVHPISNDAKRETLQEEVSEQNNDSLSIPSGNSYWKRLFVSVLIGTIFIIAVVKFILPVEAFTSKSSSVGNNADFTEFVSDGGTYVPVDDEQRAISFRLTYYQEAGANSPICSILYSDDFEILTNDSCAGDFAWCLLDYDLNDLGSMKLQFTADGTAAYIDIIEGQFAWRYETYIAALSGRLKRVQTAEQVREIIEESRKKTEQLVEQRRLEAEAEENRLAEEARKRKEAIETQSLVTYSTINDLQGNEYRTVTIGTQVWMADNLNVSTFQNGDPIPEVRSAEEWASAKENRQPAWCFFDNNPSNGDTHGRLYNWFALKDQRSVCPTGWHVPSDAEWTTLTNYLGSNEGHKIKSKRGWPDSAPGANGSGFSALPGGFRNDDGTFSNIGITAYWWSFTRTSANYAWSRSLYSRSGNVSRTNVTKTTGLSVRCIKD